MEPADIFMFFGERQFMRVSWMIAFLHKDNEQNASYKNISYIFVSYKNVTLFIADYS